MNVGILAVLASAGYAAIVVQAVLSSPGALDRLYTAHPVAASCAFVMAISGIVTAQAAQGSNKHKARITLHGYIQVAAVLLSVSTNAIIYTVKERNNKPHLTSWHGRLGALTTCLFIMLQISGGVAWYLPALAAKAGPISKAYVQHGIFGTLAFLALMTTHSLALAGGYQGFKYAKQPQQWAALAGLLALTALPVLWGVRRLQARARRVLFAKAPAKAAGKAE